MTPNYDRLAAYYDILARIVFGNKLELAKSAHLDLIQPGDRILVVGGGSGSLLKAIERNRVKCQVDFVEISGPMIQRAKQHSFEVISVQYFDVDILVHQSQPSYDLVFTNFFFDQFKRLDCLRYIEHLKLLGRKGAKLVYADFVKTTRLSERMLISLMYSFFRLTVKLGKVQLIDHKALFLECGLKFEKSRSISSTIVSEVYILD